MTTPSTTPSANTNRELTPIIVYLPTGGIDIVLIDPATGLPYSSPEKGEAYYG